MGKLVGPQGIPLPEPDDKEPVVLRVYGEARPVITLRPGQVVSIEGDEYRGPTWLTFDEGGQYIMVRLEMWSSVVRKAMLTMSQAEHAMIDNEDQKN